MDEFIREHIKELKRPPNVPLPKPAECMIVTELAPRSLAAEAGVAVKDFLVTLDEEPAAVLVPQTYVYRALEHRWVFYSRPRHERIELHATGIEPGVTLQHTTDAIKGRYDPRKSSPTELEAIWEARDWAALKSLSALTLAAYGQDRDTPALMFLGAATYEAGQRDEGLALVSLYQERYARHWTMNFNGIAFYYRAMALLEDGEKERGLDLLHTAFEHNRCRRLAEALEKHTGDRPALEEPRWLDQTFPVAYRLPRLEAQSEEVALEDALRKLGPGELFAVFMLRYQGFAKWFAPYLKGLHVVTMETERRTDYAHYFRGEDAVRKAGLPLELLLEDGGVSSAVGQTGSPFVVLLDRERRVRSEGELSSVDLWNALARQARG